jgi:zinc transport system permease protein
VFAPLLLSAGPGIGFWQEPINIRVLIALALVGLCCGGVGSLVVGSRMAFFSDALAHCAFAGVTIGFIIFDLFLKTEGPNQDEAFWNYVPWIMVAFGALVGSLIALIRSRTGLASDTVIGVCFAGAIGLAATLSKVFKNSKLFNLEDFLFGNLVMIQWPQIYILCGLAVVTFVSLAWMYNYLLLDNFNSSLAQSRRVPVTLMRYLFIILLAVIVNLCVRLVGVMLINALLIVPAATAVNLSRNLRQLFWMTLGLSLIGPLLGQWLSWEVEVRSNTALGISGTVVLVSVGLFLVSMLIGPWLRAHKRAVASSP